MTAERRAGFACAIAVLFVWSGFLLFSRLSVKQAFTAWDMEALRTGGAFLLSLPLIAIFGFPRVPWRHTLFFVVTGGMGFPLAAYLGFGFAPASHGAVMLPGLLAFVSAALGAIYMGERWTRRRVVSLLVTAAGIALLARDTFGDHPGAWRGDLLFLAGNLFWSFYTLQIRRWGHSALAATLAISFWSAIFYLPVWWLLLPSHLGSVAPGPIGFQVVYQGCFAMVLAGFLFSQAVTKIGAATTTTITALVPCLVALAAWPLLDEPLGAVGLAGIALVSAAMVVGIARRA